MQSFFARLENISRILRIFQAALVPPAPALPEKAAFGIATAASSHPLLPCALMEAAERVLAQLGGAPDFCFLQTEAAPSPHLRLAPQLAQTFLRGGRWGLQPVPVLVGSTSAALDATVVLTAATLPGPLPCPAASCFCGGAACWHWACGPLSVRAVSTGKALSDRALTAACSARPACSALLCPRGVKASAC